MQWEVIFSFSIVAFWFLTIFTLTYNPLTYESQFCEYYPLPNINPNHTLSLESTPSYPCFKVCPPILPITFQFPLHTQTYVYGMALSGAHKMTLYEGPCLQSLCIRKVTRLSWRCRRRRRRWWWRQWQWQWLDSLQSSFWAFLLTNTPMGGMHIKYIFNNWLQQFCFE